MTDDKGPDNKQEENDSWIHWSSISEGEFKDGWSVDSLSLHHRKKIYELDTSTLSNDTDSLNK